MEPVTSLPRFFEDIVSLHHVLEASVSPCSDCFKPASQWPMQDDVAEAARNVATEREKCGNYTLKVPAFFLKQEDCEMTLGAARRESGIGTPGHSAIGGPA